MAVTSHVLVCMAISSHASTHAHEQAGGKGIGDPLNRIALLLLALHPADAFLPSGVHHRGGNSGLVSAREALLSRRDRLGQHPEMITLTTQTRIKGSAEGIQRDFLATPSKWPSFVLSSSSVQDQPAEDKPLRVQDTVKEIFGLPPVLPLSVEWECKENSFNKKSQRGVLDVVSAEGLAGVASSCRMLFSVSQYDDETADVQLEMSFEPKSPLAVLALPALVLDNTIALKVLLPDVIRKARLPPIPPFQAFTDLMGILYLLAGLAHAADISGPSALLVAAGMPSFADLPMAGQAAAIAWCAAGPVSFSLSRGPSPLPVLGLVVYGAVEVACAAAASAFVTSNPPAVAPMVDALPNAIGVQIAVFASYLFCLSKGQSEGGA